MALRGSEWRARGFAHGTFHICRVARIKQIVEVFLKPRATLNEVGLVLLRVMVSCLAHDSVSLEQCVVGGG